MVKSESCQDRIWEPFIAEACMNECMYIFKGMCVCVHVPVSSMCEHTCSYVNIHVMPVWMCAHMKHMCVHRYACVFVWAHVNIHECLCEGMLQRLKWWETSIYACICSIAKTHWQLTGQLLPHDYALKWLKYCFEGLPHILLKCNSQNNIKIWKPWVCRLTALFIHMLQVTPVQTVAPPGLLLSV